MTKNSIRIVSSRTLTLCLAVLTLPLAAYSQPAPSSRGKRFGWQIGVGNPNAAVPNSMSIKDFTLPSSIYNTGAWCTDINPSGMVCGYFIDAYGELSGFVGKGLNYTIIPATTPLGIADDGTVAGYDGVGFAFIYKNGVTTSIPDTTYRSISQQGTVLYYDNYQMVDYTWKDGVTTLVNYPTPPEGVYQICGWDLNSNGEMLVYLYHPEHIDLVRLTNGAWVSLPPLPIAPTVTSGGINSATLLDNGHILFTISESTINSTGTAVTTIAKAYILEGDAYIRLSVPSDLAGLRTMTATNGCVSSIGLPFIAGVYETTDGTFKSYLAGPSTADF
jgi:hypothetical protein